MSSEQIVPPVPVVEDKNGSEEILLKLRRVGGSDSAQLENVPKELVVPISTSDLAQNETYLYFGREQPDQAWMTQHDFPKGRYFTIPANYISSVHFSIIITRTGIDNILTLTDHSRNGTGINGQLLGLKKAFTLKDGTRISFLFKHDEKIVYEFNCEKLSLARESESVEKAAHVLSSNVSKPPPPHSLLQSQLLELQQERQKLQLAYQAECDAKAEIQCELLGKKDELERSAALLVESQGLVSSTVAARDAANAKYESKVSECNQLFIRSEQLVAECASLRDQLQLREKHFAQVTDAYTSETLSRQLAEQHMDKITATNTFLVSSVDSLRVENADLTLKIKRVLMMIDTFTSDQNEDEDKFFQQQSKKRKIHCEEVQEVLAASKSVEAVSDLTPSGSGSGEQRESEGRGRGTGNGGRGMGGLGAMESDMTQVPTGGLSMSQYSEALQSADAELENGDDMTPPPPLLALPRLQSPSHSSLHQTIHTDHVEYSMHEKNHDIPSNLPLNRPSEGSPSMPLKRIFGIGSQGMGYGVGGMKEVRTTAPWSESKRLRVTDGGSGMGNDEKLGVAIPITFISHKSCTGTDASTGMRGSGIGIGGYDAEGDENIDINIGMGGTGMGVGMGIGMENEVEVEEVSDLVFKNHPTTTIDSDCINPIDAKTAISEVLGGYGGVADEGRDASSMVSEHGQMMLLDSSASDGIEQQ